MSDLIVELIKKGPFNGCECLPTLSDFCKILATITKKWMVGWMEDLKTVLRITNLIFYTMVYTIRPPWKNNSRSAYGCRIKKEIKVLGGQSGAKAEGLNSSAMVYSTRIGPPWCTLLEIWFFWIFPNGLYLHHEAHCPNWAPTVHTSRNWIFLNFSNWPLFTPWGPLPELGPHGAHF